MHVESGIIFVTVTRRYCFRQLLLTTRIVVFRNKKIVIPDARRRSRRPETPPESLNIRHQCWFILANYLAGHVLAKYFPSSINLAFRVEVASIT